MKKSTFILIAAFICLGNLVFAQRHKIPTEKINVMTDAASMQMDLASYGNIAYEAVLSTDVSDFSEPTPILINKYVDNAYDSTLCITLDEFKNYEFREHYSHYNYLKLYMLGPDEFILTVYYSFSTNRFVFLRIKGGEVISAKGYNLKNQHAYEQQYYAFNGKDRVYVAFNGNSRFSGKGFDLYLMAFDLDGNLINSVTNRTDEHDNLSGLAAVGDYVYFSMKSGNYSEKQVIIQFSKDLEQNKIWAYKQYNSDIRAWELNASEDNLIVSFIKEGDDTTFITRYSADGTFISSYDMDIDLKGFPKRQSFYTYPKTVVTDDSIDFFGQILTPNEDYWDWELEPDSYYLAFSMDWNGNKLYEHRFSEYDSLGLRNFAFINGKYFCTGEHIFESYGISYGEGIGHIAYNYLVEDIAKDTDFVTFTKTDVDPFAIPDDSDDKEHYDKSLAFWQDNLVVEPEPIPDWDFSYTLGKIHLNFAHTNPDSDELISGIPLFPFSER